MVIKSYFVLATLACLGSRLQAQSQANSIPSKKTVDSILSEEHLASLSGDPTTLFSSGFDVRARTIQRLFRDCTLFYEQQFPADKFAVHLYLLNKDDWQRLPLGFPYGMPFYHPDYDILVIGAEKDALAKLTGLKDIKPSPDSVLTNFDYQPVHELGHYFFFTLNGLVKEKWFNEFLATYFLICYIKDRNLAPDLQKALQADYPVAHRSLDDFQKIYLGVGPQNYHWYQSKFAELGFRLYPQFKTSLIKEVLDNYSPTGKQLNGVALLTAIAPDVATEWLQQMH